MFRWYRPGRDHQRYERNDCGLGSHNSFHLYAPPSSVRFQFYLAVPFSSFFCAVLCCSSLLQFSFAVLCSSPAVLLQFSATSALKSWSIRPQRSFASAQDDRASLRMTAFRMTRPSLDDLQRRPQPSQPLGRVIKCRLLLTEGEAYEVPAVLLPRIEARAGNGRHADLLGHPLRECHVVQIAQL